MFRNVLAQQVLHLKKTKINNDTAAIRQVAPGISPVTMAKEVEQQQQYRMATQKDAPGPQEPSRLGRQITTGALAIFGTMAALIIVLNF
jgi:hypothetical protein